MINEKFLMKNLFEFKTLNKKNGEVKQIGIFFEGQFIYDQNLEMLKIVIFNIKSKRKNHSPSNLF